MDEVYKNLSQAVSDDLRDFGQDNENQHLLSNDITELLIRVETLYEFIEQELSLSESSQDNTDHLQIEAWSDEIDLIYKKVGKLPVYTPESLKAKIKLNLLMIEKSSNDEVYFKLCRQNILEAVDAFAATDYGRVQRQIGNI